MNGSVAVGCAGMEEENEGMDSLVESGGKEE